MASLILTLVGPDRPGLVARIAEQVAASGGNWQESRMAHLAGKFAGIVQFTLPDAALPALTAALQAAAIGEGLQVTLHPAEPEAAPASPPTALTLELVCQDRPGIVRDVTRILSSDGVNIEELTTHLLSGSFSGEALFRAEAQLTLPPTVTIAQLRYNLEQLGNDLMVDIALREQPPAAPV